MVERPDEDGQLGDEDDVVPVLVEEREGLLELGDLGFVEGLHGLLANII